MGQLHQTLKKLSPLYHIDKGLFDTLHPMGTQAEAQFDARKASEKALKSIEDDKPIPIPDEAAVTLNARRAAVRKAGTGRASTFMSSDYGFGG